MHASRLPVPLFNLQIELNFSTETETLGLVKNGNLTIAKGIFLPDVPQAGDKTGPKGRETLRFCS